MQNSRWRAAAPAAVVLASALALSSCSGGTTDTVPEEPVSGGTLVYASGDAEPTCLDPHVGGNYPQALVASQFLETLYTKDQDGQIVPWLASGADVSDDGTTVTLHLREGISFSDGTAFDAAAVKANIEHVLDPETGSSTGYLAMQKVESMEVIDPATLELGLSAPDAALFESFTQTWNAMMSPAGLERSQEENCAAPIGTGPFVVEDWARQESVSLTRNDDYTVPNPEATADPSHTGPAYLEGIEWRFIPESATRYSALQSGTVDMIDNAQPDSIASAEQSDAIEHLDAPRPGASNRIELNSSKAPFDDARVREAFVRSVDVDAAVDSLFFGTAERSYSPLSSVEPMGYSDESLFGYDPDEAARLLDEAGWTERDAAGYRVKDGERLSVHLPISTNQSVPAEQSLFEQLQATAKESGIEVTTELLDLGSWYGALGEHEYDLVSAPYTKVGPDVLRILFHSDSTEPAPSGYFANHAMVRDEGIDAALEDASSADDEAERASLYADVQAEVLEGYYLLPLYDQQNHFLHSTSLRGIGETTAVATPTFHNAWLAD
ncbi:ABC transporter substrate-binding protein [Zhihengliuella salsuginis]|uniref:Peptide ABC transporter n=1 Tax=Zhihengliuella salsuginis TaxID=578222 RepID=A0ABQ3GKM2_9MICC|nr:ABC transporter substrate-binding protein [Zhihengliuella salsuginis]GHD09305.1 peptide ABC transporter [Zhihengliuella salsuginis]